VDEFQNFSTDSFATIMSEARKYHLNLIVANQFTTQLTEEIRDAVFGNMVTIVSFRVGQNDVDVLARYFQPAFEADDLLRVPNFNTITRTLIGGVPTQPFSMSTLPPLGKPNPKLSSALKQLSAAKFGHPRDEVEKTIFERLATKQLPPGPGGAGLPAGAAGTMMPPWGAAPAGAAPQRPYGYPGAPAPKAAQPSGSFLDEWLVKRKNPSPAVSGPARRTAGSQPGQYGQSVQPFSPGYQPAATQMAGQNPQNYSAHTNPKAPQLQHTKQHHVQKASKNSAQGNLSHGDSVSIDRNE
jgi:hypothetical protein